MSVLKMAFCLILLLPCVTALSQFNISTTFNGGPVSPSIANFTLESSEDGRSLIVTVRAAFNGDPAPPVDEGAFFGRLHKYEVAEVYFANEAGQYFQLQIGPYGQWRVFLFTDYRISGETTLPVTVTATIDRTTSSWNGSASVPVTYLPAKLSKFNANYIRGVEPKQEFFSFSPAPATETVPDFHDLSYFAAIDFDTIIPDFSLWEPSYVWTNILQKPLQYTIHWTWNATLLDQPSSEVSIDSSSDDTLTVTITSPFYNDPPPNVPDGKRTAALWQFESAEVFFLNPDDEYFQLMVGPRGHYFSAMYDGVRNKIRRNILLNVTAQISRDRKTWTAMVNIPTTYLPRNVTNFNAYYSHGMGDERQYEAYAPAYFRETHADYHKLQYFTRIYLDKVIPGLSARPKSQTWIDVQEKPFRFQILTDIFNEPLVRPQSNITLDSTADGNIQVTFESQFFEYAKPSAPDNSRIYGMWNYERAEVYFSNDAGQYFDVLLGPYGHYNVYLFDKYRTVRNSNLKLEVSAIIDPVTKTWTGSIIIPITFFPHKVTRWNAFYARGNGPEAIYEAFGPSHFPFTRPDFHKLDNFPNIDLDKIIPGFSQLEESQLWKGPLVYDVMSTWNGDPITHTPTTITLDSSDNNTLTVSVSSLFYGDPAPPVPGNSSYRGLWQYEIADIFFANDRGEYFQLEFGPYGHNNAILLAGERVYKRTQLPLEISTSIADGKWTGTVSVPTDYLPQNVTSFNCFYTHGVAPDRNYEAYRANSDGDLKPDFHILRHFALIDLDEVIPDLSSRAISDIWSDALQGRITYEIKTLWNGDPIDHDPIRVILEGTSDELYLNIEAPFFDDPKPTCNLGEPCDILDKHEVVEAFFLNDENQFLDVKFGPHGQQLVQFWIKNGTSTQVRSSSPIEVTTSITGNRWTGRATIPADYFPPKVTRFNAYARHNLPPNRVEESLYPQNPTDEVADSHALEYFRPIDLTSVVAGQFKREPSQLWVDAVKVETGV